MQTTTTTEPPPSSTAARGPRLADAILADDDLAWRRRYIPGAAR